MKMLTAAELRAFGSLPDHTIIPLTAPSGPVLADALEIADSTARSDIECHCGHAVPYQPSERHWYDLGTADPEDRAHVDQAERYLTSRGLLDRHPENARWVSPRGGV